VVIFAAVNRLEPLAHVSDNLLALQFTMSADPVTYRLYHNPVCPWDSERFHSTNEWGKQIVGIGDIMRSELWRCSHCHHRTTLHACCQQPLVLIKKWEEDELNRLSKAIGLEHHEDDVDLYLPKEGRT
jgi:hypothetical protein